jgi:hypothetical protein
LFVSWGGNGAAHASPVLGRPGRRDGAVDYVHKAMGRLMLGGPESVKVIDLREASDLTEARSN